MPYIIKKVDSEFCVFKKDDPNGKTLGCHSTKKKAQDQIIAINISEAVMKSLEKYKEKLDKLQKI